MPSPFPGMDPYLERPGLWPNIHSRLIVAIGDELVPVLRPRYYVAIEERTVLLGPDDLALTFRPDVTVARSSRPVEAAGRLPTAGLPGVVTVELPMLEEVREVYLEIREVGTDRVITVIEVLSPTNKLPGMGRRQYEQKRLSLLGTLTHLVEIDLLRAGEPMPMLGAPPPSDYRILVSRGERRPQADLAPFSVRQPVPPVPIPLQPGDSEPLLDLNRILHTQYERAGLDLRIDYRQVAEPPLQGEDATWVDALLRQAGLR